MEESERSGVIYLVEPVGVDDSEAAQFPSSTLLSNRTLAPLELELGYSLVSGLTVDNTLWHWPLASTTSHTDTVHHKALTYIHITTSQVTSLLSLNKNCFTYQNKSSIFG